MKLLTLKDIETQFMKDADRVCERVQSGHRQSWDFLEGALGPVMVAYAMLVILPEWLGIT